MTLRCADCRRALNKPALTIGAYSFGPVCSKRYYVFPTRTLTPVLARRQRAAQPADPLQLPLELEVA